jgi:hypothetical protein
LPLAIRARWVAGAYHALNVLEGADEVGYGRDAEREELLSFMLLGTLVVSTEYPAPGSEPEHAVPLFQLFLVLPKNLGQSAGFRVVPLGMEFIIHAAELAVALLLIAASFIYIFSPRNGRELVRRALIGLLVLVGAAVVLPNVFGPTHVAGWTWFLLLPLLSSLAYGIRQVMRPKARHGDRDQGRERTAVIVNRLPGEE